MPTFLEAHTVSYFSAHTCIFRSLSKHLTSISSNRQRTGMGHIHMSAGIICASLPTYRPLMIKCSRSLTALRQRYKLSSSSDLRASQSDDSGWKRMMMKDSSCNKINPYHPEQSGDDQIHLAEAVGGVKAGGNGYEACEEPHPAHSIIVKSTISIE